jgi:hypothetical protein
MGRRPGPYPKPSFTVNGLITLVAVVALGNALIGAAAYPMRRRLLVSGLTFDQIHRRQVGLYAAFNAIALGLAALIVLGRWIEAAIRHHWDLPQPRSASSLAGWAVALLWGASVGLGDAAVWAYRRGAGNWPVAALLALSALVGALVVWRLARRWADPGAGV